MHDRTVTAERSSGMTEANYQRRYPIGAELMADGRVHCRIWAPKADRLEVAVEGKFYELEAEAGGYFSGAIAAGAGAFYRFRINEAESFHPDPASRFR